MRFTKRMAAAFLAVVMIATSVQGPCGVSYAAESVSGSMGSGQGAVEPLVEENSEEGSESAAADGDNQTGEETEIVDTAEETGTEETVKEGGETTETDGTVTEETDTAKTEREEAATAETEPEEAATAEAAAKVPTVKVEEAVIEADLDAVYQFGGAPSDADGIATHVNSDAEDYLYRQLLKRTEKISLDGYNIAVDDLNDLLNTVMNEHPDLYACSGYSAVIIDDKITITVTYSTEYDDDAFRKKTAEALSYVSDEMSDFEKAAALHDYLVVNVEYDNENYLAGTIPHASYDAYGALVDGVAVCNGYALAYKYLLSMVDIECYMVTSRTMNHAWNMVKLGGRYYHVDTTWDDPVWDRVGRVYHTYMFRSDANLERHSNWTVTSGSGTVDYKATDTTYESAFWVNSTASLVFDGRDCYYISPYGGIMKASFSDCFDSGTEIANIEGEWSDGRGGWRDGFYSGLYQIDGRLFYNDAVSIYSIRKDGTDRKTEFTLLDTEDNDGIFGSAYCGGRIVYTLHAFIEGPNQSGKEIVLTADPDNQPVLYRIYYELNGGMNNIGNPGRYASESKAITLKAPRKEGFRFDGWYEDAGFTRKVEVIQKGRKGDITLYAKWIEEEALDVQNPGWIFTSLDDKNVRSKADGKPKILFFFKTSNCPLSLQASMDLRDHIREFSGVDIYAVEVSGSTKDVVSGYKKDYGCEEITYCYDTTRKVNEPALEDYVHTAGINNTYINLPVFAYIDVKNRLQKVTIGPGSEVLETLQRYCGNDDYLIHYVLKGGTNHPDNPEMYQSSAGVALKDPVKAGDTFEGWYKDAWYTEKVTGIPKGTKGNVTLFAKWKSSGEGGLGLDNLDYTFVAVDLELMEVLDSKADDRPKLLAFFEEEDPACQKTLRNIANNIADFVDVDVYALSMTPIVHSVEGMQARIAKLTEDYGCDKIHIALDSQFSPSNLDKAEAYQEATGLKGTALPLLCYIDKDNKLQWASEGEQTSEVVLKNLQEYCGLQLAEVYQITYELDGGTNHPENPASYTAEGLSIYFRDPEKPGCVFGGWYKDARFREKVPVPYSGAGDITIYAKWRCGLEIPNLHQAYIGLDGVPVDSIPRGKPKLLVFFEETGRESRNTVKNITAVIDSLDGVDIVAVECGKASWEDVQAFKDAYGCSDIAFAIENRRGQATNAEMALEYVKEAGLPESMDYPILCYIDSEWKLQWVTKKEQTGEEILENLRKYCWYIPGESGQQDGSEAEFKIDLDDNTFVYNGKEHKPRVTVTAAGQNGSGTILEENTDYTLSYRNNKNAGTAKVIVKGMGEYKGTVEETFTIEPAPLIIRAVDRVILVGDKIPTEYEYEADGLLGLDELVKEPEFICDIVSTAKEGEYTVTPTGADAGSNYVITYESGRLTVTTEYILWKVTFDTRGHGEAPAALSGVRSGDTIESPDKPKADGYRFDGWYRDPECKKAWNFETDIVETDITLYAKWLCVSSGGSFALQEVPDQYYTGKALKPAVSVYDGDTLLKAGRDYQVKYYNNINTNGGRKTGNGEGANFKSELPYVEITGKGNYKSTVKVNFNILKISIGDSSMDPVAGAVLKVNDHLAKSSTALKPSVSLKIGKALKKDTDFMLELQPIHAFDASDKLLSTLAGAEIPAGATGEFKLLIKGTGNYEGSIVKQIYVADKDHLMKNAKITLGKNLKNVEYTGKPIRLTPSNEDGDDVFTVRIGQKILDPETDYLVYPSERSAGKAELVVMGIGDYVGKRTASFNIKGKVFSNSTVSISGITDRTYTGKAHMQNKEAVVTYKEMSKPLVYGTDYTISYSKNINKGTATVTFIGNPKAGYSGKVKKTFKIAAVDIATVKKDSSMNSIAVSYARAGAKPVDEIILMSNSGVRLRGGKDYTLKYKDNRAVTTKATVTVTGKGNYTGKFDVTFAITAADLSADSIVVKNVAVAYDDNKADDFVYTPAIKVMDGKAALKADKDFEIEYLKNTQKDYNDYLDKLKKGSAKDEDVPRVRITAKAGSNYGLPGDIKEIDVPLQIYQTKFNKTELDVRIGEAVYTGGQVIPDVTVSYNGKTLREGADYMLTYGANDKAGKNKGSVTVNGLAPYYGGSVTCKFEISGKDLKF